MRRLHAHQIVRLLKPGLQLVIKVVDRSDRNEVNVPIWTVVLGSNHFWALQPSMERETRHEMILARREPRETDAGDADEPRFLRKDLDIAERAQDVDELPGEPEDRRIGAGKQGVERETPTRMPEIPGDEARTTLRADPHRLFLAWHAQ